MDGVTVPLEQPFITPAGSRLMYPGDRSLGALAGEVVNCRCTVVGVMQENESASASRDSFDVPAPSAQPRSQTWMPTGSPWRNFLRLPRKGLLGLDYEVFKLVEEAAAIASRVHGLQGLPRVPVVQRLLDADELARYTPDPKTGDPAYIGIESGKTTLLAILEEFGHMIDHQAFYKNQYASLKASMGEGPLARWWSVINQTTAIQDLRSLRRAFYTYDVEGQKPVDRSFVAYLLRPDEIFARSYRQFIAVYSGDRRLLQAVGSRQNKPGFEIGYTVQWTDDEFEAIALELEQVFRRLGWLR